MKLTQKKIGLSVIAVAAALFATATLADMMPPPHGMMMTEADGNKDGKVSKEEFDAWRTARAVGLDADKDGLVSASELAAERVRMAEAEAKDFSEKMVARLDTDKDAKLSAAEFAAAPMPGFEMMDHNKDGVIDQAEMQDMHGKGRSGKNHGHHKGGMMPEGGMDMPGNN